MKPETEIVLNRLRQNMAYTPDVIAKQDLLQIIEALVELIVEEEPKVIRNDIDMSIKAHLFFKAIIRLGLAGAEAALSGDADPNNEFMKRMQKFLNLQAVLERYSK